MEYKVISTGSKGNAVLINGVILIDIGVSFKTIKKYLKDIKLVLLTHIHGDHLNKKTLKKVMAERPSLRVACCPELYETVVETAGKTTEIDVLTRMDMFKYDNIATINYTYLYHDVANVAWHVELPTGEKALYATDTIRVDHIKAKDYDVYFLESNFLEEEIQEQIDEKKRQLEYAYQERAIETHLSHEKAEEFFIKNATPTSLWVKMHESKNKGITKWTTTQ
jgi:L-ascorbate metabolism protein UlaG (beta-lactamase superfamily)